MDRCFLGRRRLGAARRFADDDCDILVLVRRARRLGDEAAHLLALLLLAFALRIAAQRNTFGGAGIRCVLVLAAPQVVLFPLEP